MNFEVIPASVPCNREDWFRALAIDASELPELTSQQVAEHGKFRLPLEKFKRTHIVLPQMTRERQAAQGRSFGLFVEEMLEPLGFGYEVVSVSRRGTPEGWRVSIRRQGGGEYEFQSPFDVVEALVDGRATPEQRSEFSEQLWAELGHSLMQGAGS